MNTNECDRAHLLDWSEVADLGELNVRMRAPASPGVYVLWGMDTRTCVYIGHTRDLLRRLLDHAAGSYRNPRLRHYGSDLLFQVAVVHDRDALPRVAGYLHQRLAPRLNRKAPGGEPILVNLPRVPD